MMQHESTIENIQVDNKRYEFYFDKDNDIYCLRFFTVNPLSPMEAELINEACNKSFEWNYENKQVNFWPKDRLCNDKDEIMFDILIKILDVLVGFTTKLSLAKHVIEALSNWLTYIEENILVSKQLVSYADTELQVVFKTYIIDDTFKIELSLNGLVLSTATAHKLKDLVKEIDNDVYIMSTYPFFKASISKDAKNIVEVLKFYKKVLTMLT